MALCECTASITRVHQEITGKKFIFLEKHGGPFILDQNTRQACEIFEICLLIGKVFTGSFMWVYTFAKLDI